MRIDLSRLSSRQRAYALGFRQGLQRARKELGQELRTLQHRHVREIVDLQRDLGQITAKYHERLLVDAAIVECAQMAPGTRLH